MYPSSFSNLTPLHYEISDWRQADKCLSNNSRKLHIVTSVIIDPALNGLRLRVDHEDFGTLFACVVDARGELLSTDNTGEEDYVHEFTTAEILAELYKYGFYIDFKKEEHLSGNMIDFLMSINKLGYDKIRIMAVWEAPLGTKEFKNYVTVFNSELLVDWLNAGYSTSKAEYDTAIREGNAFNVTALLERDKKHFNWTWLWNTVMNIEDILADNTDNLI